MEINYGIFECVIEVPPGYDLGRARAAYQNGFLRVEVPHAARSSSSTLSRPNFGGLNSPIYRGRSGV
jgi:HSP20 family molecular chaperone IbpA